MCEGNLSGRCCIASIYADIGTNGLFCVVHGHSTFIRFIYIDNSSIAMCNLQHGLPIPKSRSTMFFSEQPSWR